MVSTEKKTVATALETSSWAVAAAHGFEDGQLMPRDFMLAITQRIAACVTVPVTADFEGGHAVSPPGYSGVYCSFVGDGYCRAEF
ncbi:MAG: isocitrate lyase/phosphoenolpyruvate mutase family protein [Paracoccaceae bacterium]|nr:isocitrate lyase/phosphoenolpyruvate mutase family protein [Paracoccaceae bacterium]